MNVIEIINLAPIVAALDNIHWAVAVIKWLSGLAGIALGVILFTIILKAITLPFDFISRAKMRKNSLIMEEMRPELEKLQKQYANDKMLYNQKMTALYKKNGYSMWGACLPTIITLVIFIVAINAFNAFSQYANRSVFYEMSIAYNNAVFSGIEVDNDYIKQDKENGTITIDYDRFLNRYDEQPSATVNYKVEKNQVLTDKVYAKISSDNNFIDLFVNYTEDNGTLIPGASYFSVNYERLNANKMASKDNNDLKILVYNDTAKTEKEETFAEYKEGLSDVPEGELALSFTEQICGTMAAKQYRTEPLQFLWVKNIWVTDSPLSHPVNPTNTLSVAQSGCNCNTCGAPKEDISDNDYTKIVSKLDKEKTEPNGFFILSIITAGMSFLMQFVSNRSNKAQMELQTVDGQGAATQKMMMWIMPIMMAVFSFMYTAAFSIYMILSSVLSIINTLGINWIVDRKYKKNKPQNEEIHGRVYSEKPEEAKPVEKPSLFGKKNKEPIEADFVKGTVKEQKKVQKLKEEGKLPSAPAPTEQPENKDKKKNKEEKKGDFMGEKPVKHIRGRLK